MKSTQIRQFLLPALVLAGKLFAQFPTPAHVVIAIEENHDYTQIIGSAAAPYINALAADSNAALFTQSYGLTHPSQPNYIMLFSGSNQGVIDDGLPSGLPFTTANLGASLIYAGRTFTGYSEDLPYVGYNGTTSGAYARKHNPWVNWQSSPTNGLPITTNVPLTNFPVQFDSLPSVSFVIPNQNNDMHNGSDPARISTGDTWLQSHLDGYVQWAKTHNSLFVLTFDEGTTTGSNRIVTLFVGAMVRHGQYNETITHYSILRTLEDMYGLPHAGGSVIATPIVDCWAFSIFANAGAHGTISPDGNVVVTYGSNQVFIISPNSGYDVDSVEVDGARVDSTSRYSFVNVTGNHTIRATFKTSQVVEQIHVVGGWNIVSIPLLVDDGRRVVVFPSAVSSAYAFDSTGYFVEDSLRRGSGYWLKFASAQTVDISGYAQTEDTINVRAGWNLIGSISIPTPTSSIIQIPSSIVASLYYEYTGGYSSVDTLRSGNGYWVKTNQTGKLVLR
jgi:hypothetical protein